MPDDGRPSSATDPFSRFWTDFLSRMTPAAGAGAAPSPQQAWSDEAVKQMQRVFFDALAKYCEDFMRSEQFLTVMKQTLDRSLALKRQMDQFLTQAVEGIQMPARADIEDLSGLLRSTEERILDRVAALEAKVASEQPRGIAKKRAAVRPAGRKTARQPSRKRGTPAAKRKQR